MARRVTLLERFSLFLAHRRRRLATQHEIRCLERDAKIERTEARCPSCRERILMVCRTWLGGQRFKRYTPVVGFVCPECRVVSDHHSMRFDPERERGGWVVPLGGWVPSFLSSRIPRF